MKKVLVLGLCLFLLGCEIRKDTWKEFTEAPKTNSICKYLNRCREHSSSAKLCLERGGIPIYSIWDNNNLVDCKGLPTK